jgi:hypothetical protein
VLEHLTPYENAIDEIYRVLKPGGILVVSVPRFVPEWLCWTLSSQYHSTPGGHVRIFRIRALKRAVTEHGFTFRERHWAHALRNQYWSLQCAFWATREHSRVIAGYHKLGICCKHRPSYASLNGSPTRSLARALSCIFLVSSSYLKPLTFSAMPTGTGTGTGTDTGTGTPNALATKLTDEPSTRNGPTDAWRQGQSLVEAKRYLQLQTSARFIASTQHSTGAIPWERDRKLDPWGHIEAAMGLSVAGMHARTYCYLSAQQLTNGGWWAEYDGSLEASANYMDTNHAAYIATELWHHDLASGDETQLRVLWPCVSRALDFVCAQQSKEGHTFWAVDPEPAAT